MSRRPRALFQVCACVLLLWTAVDLTNAGLCALDNEHAMGPTAAPAMTAGDTGGSGGGEPAPHVDDCFCCSRCVEPGQVATPTDVECVSSDARRPGDRLPLPDRASVYHPPQLLG